MDVEYKLANVFADKPTSQRAFEDMSALSMVTDASANACTRLCAFTDTFSSAHLCCADCAYDRFLITLPAGGEWRERRREQMAVTQCLERQVDQCATCGCRNLTCAWRQHQATATKAYKWVSAISWPSHWTAVSFVTSWKLAGWLVHVYNMHPTLREIIMVKIVLKILVHHVRAL